MEKVITTILEKYTNGGRDSLIPLLQDVQEEIGYLSKESIADIGKHLNLPSSKIYGVATFYNQFRFTPKGKFHIEVCRGTACHVLGSKTILERLQKILKIKAGETSKDGMFSLEVVACIGACGLGPVIAINGNFHSKVTEDSIEEIISKYKEQAN